MVQRLYNNVPIFHMDFPQHDKNISVINNEIAITKAHLFLEQLERLRPIFYANNLSGKNLAHILIKRQMIGSLTCDNAIVDNFCCWYVFV